MLNTIFHCVLAYLHHNTTRAVSASSNAVCEVTSTASGRKSLVHWFTVLCFRRLWFVYFVSSSPKIDLRSRRCLSTCLSAAAQVIGSDVFSVEFCFCNSHNRLATYHTHATWSVVDCILHWQAFPLHWGAWISQYSETQRIDCTDTTQRYQSTHLEAVVVPGSTVDDPSGEGWGMMVV